jgi:hypothetical protein
MGEEDYTKCPNYIGPQDKQDSNEKSEKGFLLPWTGNSLGNIDLQFLAGRSRPMVIGVVGPHNAGKTTLLAVFYLLLSQGIQASDRCFTGSYTLGGWENLAHFLRWKPDRGPDFPPHTSSSDGRMPGLLHLAFRNQNDILEDFLFTDAPGEWFEQWTINKNAREAHGAQWINRYADAFMLFVDSEALSGKKRGEARTQLLGLAQRLSGELLGRPVAVVWAKSDKEVPEGIRSTLKESFMKFFPTYEEFSVSVKLNNRVTEEAFMQLLSWLLSSQRISGFTIQDLPVMKIKDPFLSYRGL